MQRNVLGWAALSLGILASPVAAQQASGAASAPIETRYLQSVPPAPPPPRARYVAPKPPPFPPMPKVQPHKRSTKAAAHHSTKAKPARHAAVSKHKAASKRHQAASKSKHSSSKSVRPAKLHLSKKTIRQCHAMSYRQIISHKNCRALMSQEISAADQQHKAAKRHKATAPRQAKKRTSAKRRRK